MHPTVAGKDLGRYLLLYAAPAGAPAPVPDADGGFPTIPADYLDVGLVTIPEMDSTFAVPDLTIYPTTVTDPAIGLYAGDPHRALVVETVRGVYRVRVLLGDVILDPPPYSAALPPIPARVPDPARIIVVSAVLP